MFTHNHGITALSVMHWQQTCITNAKHLLIILPPPRDEWSFFIDSIDISVILILDYKCNPEVTMETLSEAESKIAMMIWDTPGITSMEVWHRCEDEYGWKKSTVFTLIRRIREKGFLTPQRSKLEMAVSKDVYYHEKSRKTVRDEYNDSLSDFITSFMRGKRLTQQETMELTGLIMRISEESGTVDE